VIEPAAHRVERDPLEVRTRETAAAVAVHRRARRRLVAVRADLGQHLVADSLGPPHDNVRRLSHLFLRDSGCETARILG